MLVSHSKKFIYTKTERTAGTSVERYFEPYCIPEGNKKQRKKYIGEAGIIGYRGKNARKRKWYSHQSAADIKSKVGEEVWNDYYKFTTIRNPFDKIVSYFHHLERIFSQRKFSELPTRRKIHKLIWKLQTGEESDPVAKFRKWINREYFLNSLGFYPGFINDRDRYIIDGNICVDYFIRFENLKGDLKHVCEKLDIPYEPNRLPGSDNNRPNLSYQDYYDRKTTSKIAEIYDMELNHFNYEIPS